MQELFRMVKMLEDVLSADNPILEARQQRSKLLKEIEEMERAMFSNYMKAQELQDELPS